MKLVEEELRPELILTRCDGCLWVVSAGKKLCGVRMGKRRKHEIYRESVNVNGMKERKGGMMLDIKGMLNKEEGRDAHIH